MGLFDKIKKGFENFDYEGAIEALNNRAEETRERVLKDFARECRKHSSDELRWNREKKMDEGHWEAVEIIEKELNRRGEYY